MKRLKQKGQSLVEFALVAMLILFLLAGAIDFGLAFFAYQGISGAAQEGAAYAAINPSMGTGGYPEIRQRVVNEAGLNTVEANRARFVNLFDLDSNGTIDNTAVQEARILISVVSSDLIDQQTNPDGWNQQTTACRNIIRSQWCAMEVQVQFRYNAFFPVAKLFGASFIELRATRRMTIGR